MSFYFFSTPSMIPKLKQLSYPERLKKPWPGFILLQAYKKLSLFMTILVKKIITFL